MERLRAGGGRLTRGAHCSRAGFSRPTSSCLASACDPRPRWPRRPASRSGNAAGSASTTTCAPATRTSSPWATLSRSKTPSPGQWTLIALAGPANRQGRIAADGIAGRDSRYRGTRARPSSGCSAPPSPGPALCEKSLVRNGDTDFEKIYLYPNSHAGYYPGANYLAMKVLFRKSDGRLLGVQAVGQDGVDKRIDAAAMVIQLGGDGLRSGGSRAVLCAAIRQRQVPAQLRRHGRRRCPAQRPTSGALEQSHETDFCWTSAIRKSSPSSMCRARSTSRCRSFGRGWASCRATARSTSSAAPASAPTTPHASSLQNEFKARNLSRRHAVSDEPRSRCEPSGGD